MVQRILSFVKHPTSRNVIINTIGNYLNVFFTAAFALVLWQIMTPEQYGVLSVLLGIAYVLANVLDFGTTATIYSYVPTLIEQKAINLYSFIKSTFFYQSIASLVVIGSLFILFPFLDKIFFKTGAPVWELYLTAISVLFLIWQNFVQHIMFASKNFVKTNIYLNIANIVKTLLLLYMTYTKTVTVGSIIFLFGIVGPLAFFILLFIERKDMLFLVAKAKVKREEFKFGYTVTYLIATQFFNLGQRMDLFLLSFFHLKADVGYYGISQKIILTIITTVVSITQVLSPGYSKIYNKAESKREFKTSALYLLVPIGLFLVLFFMPQQIYVLFFKKRHINAAAPQIAAVTRALSLPYILYAIQSLPMLFLLYTVKKPKYILYANIAFFIIVSIGCFYFIPIRGVFGPPVVIAAAFAVSAVIMFGALLREYRRLPK